jgi:hypothetical protein
VRIRHLLREAILTRLAHDASLCSPESDRAEIRPFREDTALFPFSYPEVAEGELSKRKRCVLDGTDYWIGMSSCCASSGHPHLPVGIFSRQREKNSISRPAVPSPERRKEVG